MSLSSAAAVPAGRPGRHDDGPVPAVHIARDERVEARLELAGEGIGRTGEVRGERHGLGLDLERIALLDRKARRVARREHGCGGNQCEGEARRGHPHHSRMSPMMLLTAAGGVVVTPGA